MKAITHVFYPAQHAAPLAPSKPLKPKKKSEYPARKYKEPIVGHVSIAGELKPYRASDLARYWAHVDKRGPDECWIWDGALINGRYARFTMYIDQYRIAIRAQRFALTLDGRGPETPKGAGRVVSASCGNLKCVNPAHLDWKTYALLAEHAAKNDSQG